MSPASKALGRTRVRVLVAVLAFSACAMAQVEAAQAASFPAETSQTKTVTLHLSAKAKKLLGHTHVLRVRATVSAHDPAGESATTSAVITLRLRK